MKKLLVMLLCFGLFTPVIANAKEINEINNDLVVVDEIKTENTDETKEKTTVTVVGSQADATTVLTTEETTEETVVETKKEETVSVASAPEAQVPLLPSKNLIVANYNKSYELTNSYEKIKIMEVLDNLYLCRGTDLTGKKITCIGDSITYGNGGSKKPDGTQVNYCDFIQKYSNAQVVNLGIGGSPIGDYWDDTVIVNRFHEIPADTDIIIFFAGVNDFFIGPEYFGSLNDLSPNTYCGDVNRAFNGIKYLYPNAKVYVVLTFNNKMLTYEQFADGDYEHYVNVQEQLAYNYGFKVIDLYREDFMNSNDEKVKLEYFADDVHPNDAGSELLGKHLLAIIHQDLQMESAQQTAQPAQ